MPVVARIVELRDATEDSAKPDVVGATADDDELGKFGASKIRVLVIVFLAAGIMGLPLILASKRFSPVEKVFWTVIVLLYTVVIFYALYAYIKWFGARVGWF